MVKVLDSSLIKTLKIEFFNIKKANHIDWLFAFKKYRNIR